MDNEQGRTHNPRAKIKPLASRKADGTPYDRGDNVLDCIARYQCLPESVRVADVACMPSEALVYFIRNTHQGNRTFWDRLFRELLRRAGRVIQESIRGVDRIDARELGGQVESRVMEWIVNPKPSATADLLEIRFKKAIEMAALQALRIYMRSPMGALRGQPAVQLDDDGDQMERPLELILTGGLGPEDLLLILRDTKRRHRLLRKACQAVPDRRHLKAAILRWGYDWPITSRNPKERSLTRHFGVSEKQMGRWLRQAIQAMRAALADEPEMREAQARIIVETMEEGMDRLIRDLKAVPNKTGLAGAAKGGRQ